MGNVGQIERITQNRIVGLFRNTLGYKYLGDWTDRENNSNFEEKYVRAFLFSQGHSDELINKVINAFKKTSKDSTKGLYDSNKAVYKLLRYGVNVKENVSENSKTVYLIDWKNPNNNDFYIAEEVTVKGNNTKRPDIVVYVNGIALGVIELKRSTIGLTEGIRQNLDNQKEDFISDFFSTMQLVVAGNDSQGTKYGTIETKEKYYLTWKEDDKATDKIGDKTSLKIREILEDFPILLDKQLIGLFHKERLIKIIHDLVIFDRGIKKLCRPNQFFGILSAEYFVKKRQGGIIWHTQGSGKSLTMVWLAKWVREFNPNARILIITDRDELDEQIEKVFTGVDEEIYRTKSGQDLINSLNETTPLLMCSLIHKFGKKEEVEYDDYIENLNKSLPSNYKAKGEIYVFVDECHRTQSGKLHKAMERLLPNALFIGFTGTPLLKKDKQKSIEIFGDYIHTYKFDEAVKEGIVLDLRYEARKIIQDITSQLKVDDWFEAKTRGLSDYAILKLKQKWGNMQTLLSSKSRLAQIVDDIMMDMAKKDRLQNGKGNAMLVAGSIYEACKYYELFENTPIKCAIITSYTPNVATIKGETSDLEGTTDNIEKYEIYIKMISKFFKISEEDVKKNSKSLAERFEKEVKQKFINEPAQMQLLIVVDKLLTGFDAPSATYLYIDKQMRDHNLFQAICRVNRLDNEDKTYGYIVDYKDLFKNLEKSIGDYTGEAFEDYDKEDIEGLLTDRVEKASEKLDEALEAIRALCEPVEYPKDTIDYIRYFVAKNTLNKDEIKENEHKRKALYKNVVSLLRAYASIANEMESAGYTKKESEEIKEEIIYFDKIRQEIMLASGEYIDLKAYESSMRYLFDMYISAKPSDTISALNDMTLVDLLIDRGIEAVHELPDGIKNSREATAETIENNVRKLIIDEMPTNPKYFEKMSLLLDELIQERLREIRDYEEYLKEIIELATKVKKPHTTSAYPSRINSGAKRALYDNLDNDEDLAVSLHNTLMEDKPDGWKGSPMKEKMVKRIIRDHIGEEEKVEDIFNIVKQQGEY